ncbi:MAG TPA: hypothetical protein VH475_22960 [Tepidisphaeraceae bacterium]|jgi:hypothetical protein
MTQSSPLIFVLVAIVTAAAAAAEKPQASTILAIRDTRFTVNDHPTFLLGLSLYAALGEPEALFRRDLDDLQRQGFNWIRVWATWASFDHDVSAVDVRGQPRAPFLDKLKSLVAECDRRGLVVDVTLTRGAGPGHLPDLAAHQRAIDTLVPALADHRNWYLDLANEHDIGDARRVPVSELKALRDQVRRLAPNLLVTASFGGHDLGEQDLRDALVTAGLDFVAPHRPRDAGSPAATQERTQQTLALMKRIGRNVPIHYQEPFRRGYTKWEPTADDFLTDLRGAIAGGAAGWCFHNGSQRATSDHRPRRSFDLSTQRLFDQLDPEEQKVIADSNRVATSAANPRPVR